MSTILDTVTEYETKALEQLAKVQADVIDYIKKAIAVIDERLPEFDLPENELLAQVPTIQQLVDTQFAFSKKLLANQEKFAKSIVKAIKPITREGLAKPATTTAAAAA
jgi:hypothetical protein